YEKLAKALAASGASPNERAGVARRQMILDLLAGDRAAASRHLDEFHANGGTGLSLPRAAAEAAKQSAIEIPGPLHSFARTAAPAPALRPDELLSALARNVVTNGYQAGGANETLEQTEYLKLVVRYLSQARELEKLGGESKTIKIPSCESTETSDLLRVI